MSSDTDLLHNIVKGHAESATATKLLLKNIFEVLSTISDHSADTKTFITQIKSEKEAFYRNTVKAFVIVFFALIFIIGLLLKELNVRGADAVTNVGQRGIQTQVGR